jgi:predicted nuclease of predicted toxin-antitoxin system
MRFIANENVMRTVIDGLRNFGHDVMSVKESMRGEDDEAILEKAQADNRIILTNDKDFGELAFRVGLPAECGIILLRLARSNPSEDSERALEAIGSRNDWTGHFSVITSDRIRMRPLATDADGKSAQ